MELSIKLNKWNQLSMKLKEWNRRKILCGSKTSCVESVWYSKRLKRKHYYCPEWPNHSLYFLWPFLLSFLPLISSNSNPHKLCTMYYWSNYFNGRYVFNKLTLRRQESFRWNYYLRPNFVTTLHRSPTLRRHRSAPLPPTAKALLTSPPRTYADP